MRVAAREGASGLLRRRATHRSSRLDELIPNMHKNSSFDLMKISETGQKPDLNKTLKIKFSNSYVLNSNPWLALIPTVGHD